MGDHKKVESPINWGLEEVLRQRDEWENQAENSLPPFLCRVDDAMATNVNRLECVGNGQDPITAATAWKILGGP